MTRIVVDAMGSDNFPVPDVEGAVLAAREYGVEIILVGDEARVRPVLEAQKPGSLPIRIVNAPEMLTMEDKGERLAFKARHKEAQNSMAVGIDLVKKGEADAFVTAGNTGAAMVTALFRLGRIRGVERPALAVIFPTATGSCVVLDIGANPECKPENLLQFGLMGNVYAQRVRGVQNPRVGLLSNGEEAGKGNDLVKATYPLLEKSGLNFIGNIEGKELFGGNTDVAITDGFTGNVLLKSSEAVAKLMTEILRAELMSSPITKVGALLAKPAFGRLKALLDPAEVGAAPLLGIDGLVFVGHGRSDAKALVSAIRLARQAVASDLLSAMRNAIQEQLSQMAHLFVAEAAG